MLGVRNPLNLPSCVYVWVMNHLGVVFGDAFGLFWVFGWIYGKMTKLANLGNFRGPTPRHRDPTQQRKSMPRHRTIHRHVFLSCFVIPLFQGLVYWTNEDPISV